MSTKNQNILNPTSCWNLAQTDEPLFILRANDPNAPNSVILWASQYLSEKGGFRNMTEAQARKYYDALDVARQMKEWRGKQSGLDDDIPF